MGMEIATVQDVDSQNPTGALELYQSVGCAEYPHSTIYRNEIMA